MVALQGWFWMGEGCPRESKAPRSARGASETYPSQIRSGAYAWRARIAYTIDPESAGQRWAVAKEVMPMT